MSICLCQRVSKKALRFCHLSMIKHSTHSMKSQQLYQYLFGDYCSLLCLAVRHVLDALIWSHCNCSPASTWQSLFIKGQLLLIDQTAIRSKKSKNKTSAVSKLLRLSCFYSIFHCNGLYESAVMTSDFSDIIVTR